MLLFVFHPANNKLDIQFPVSSTLKLFCHLYCKCESTYLTVGWKSNKKYFEDQTQTSQPNWLQLTKEQSGKLLNICSKQKLHIQVISTQCCRVKYVCGVFTASQLINTQSLLFWRVCHNIKVSVMTLMIWKIWNFLKHKYKNRLMKNI